MEIAAHLTSLINAFKEKKIERELAFFEGVDFCETKRRGSLHAMYKPPRQNSSNFATPPVEGNFFVQFLLFLSRQAFPNRTHKFFRNTQIRSDIILRNALWNCRIYFYEFQISV